MLRQKGSIDAEIYYRWWFLKTVSSLIYLGLPIGDKIFIDKWFEKKFKKVERAFFSIRKVGTHAGMINPKCLCFIYRQYCQSICTYGLEILSISKPLLKQIEVRQNILIKTSLGLSKYFKSTPLFKAIGIPRITELYFLFKVYFLKQIRSNGLADRVFKELLKTGLRHRKLGSSYFGQIADVSGFLGTDCLIMQESLACDLIKARFSCLDNVLVDQINNIFNNWDTVKDSRTLLKSLFGWIVAMTMSLSRAETWLKLRIWNFRTFFLNWVVSLWVASIILYILSIKQYSIKWLVFTIWMILYKFWCNI